MTDTISGAFLLLFFVGLLGGLVYWAKRAETDRSAYVGLYLVFGIPGLLLTVAGLALSVNRVDAGPLALGCGLALGLPMIKRVRVQIARVTPMDPDSPIDMAGLATILLVIMISLLTLNDTDTSSSSDDVTIATLLINVIAFVSIAYVCVGYRIWRTGEDATQRLGIRVPSPRTVLIALGCVIPAFISSIIGSALTQAFQPDVIDNLEHTVSDMTSGVNNPFGALLLGLSTGVGEEVLFRGAIQPRYGMVLASICWALLHAQYGFTFVLVGLFGIGILLGLERKYLGTSAAIITHATYNTILVLLQTYTN
ncbi:MAG TPA: type II CAAX endopeptidase family protein [Thermomicrobiales bacterium]|nr:type II CAAX endopeptidase family protein [Thermomicrobiales bacterium]